MSVSTGAQASAKMVLKVLHILLACANLDFLTLQLFMGTIWYLRVLQGLFLTGSLQVAALF